MNGKKEYVILVDKRDREKGIEEKIEAHKKCMLHRAFSILIFNSKCEILLQKRAKSKYHCGGLWTNACCSHPMPGENIENAAHRRLKEEMGFDCDLEEIGSFIYKVKFENGLSEYEYDHVLLGFYDGKVKINKEEAEDYKWVSLENLEKDIKKNPELYTPWFKMIMKNKKIMKKINRKIKGVLCKTKNMKKMKASKKTKKWKK